MIRQCKFIICNQIVNFSQSISPAISLRKFANILPLRDPDCAAAIPPGLSIGVMGLGAVASTLSAVNAGLLIGSKTLRQAQGDREESVWAEPVEALILTLTDY